MLLQMQVSVLFILLVYSRLLHYIYFFFNTNIDTVWLVQEYEDEKIALSASLMEFIENRAKQLDSDRENLGNW